VGLSATKQSVPAFMGQELPHDHPPVLLLCQHISRFKDRGALRGAEEGGMCIQGRPGGGGGGPQLGKIIEPIPLPSSFPTLNLFACPALFNKRDLSEIGREG